MSQTVIRSSSQLYIDADLDFHAKKAIALAAGVADTDGVNVAQLNTAINNAIAGSGNEIHEPVQDLAGAKAVGTTDTVIGGITTVRGRVDKMIMLVEDLGLYRYDAQSTATSNDGTVIRPTDVASDAAAGRWIRISSILTDHNNLSNIQGGAVGDYQHLTTAQVTALHPQETAVTIGALINGAGAAVPNDTDLVATTVSGGILQKITWTNVKNFLETYFNGKYWKQNATGDVTINSSQVTAIGTSKVVTGMIADANVTTVKILDDNVTNVKLANMATQTFKGRTAAGTGDPEDLTITQVKALLNIGAQSASVRTYRATPVGTVNGSNVTFTIAALILSGTEEVYKNGILMNAGAGNDYTIAYAATTTITFATAPSSIPFVDTILVSYSV